jgi:hypothetical protein
MIVFLGNSFTTMKVCASVTEDFENVTVVDANGEALSSSWAAGGGLSNGWKIIGGTIYTSDTGNYQLVHNAGKGWLFSDYYLTSSSTSVNEAYVFIPVKMSGKVELFAKSNLDERSKKTSTLIIYEATEDGSITDSVLYSATLKKGGSWGLHAFNIEETDGKYIAINLVYTDIDDVTYTEADGSTVIVPELTVSATIVDFGTSQTAVTKTITVKSNVATNVSMELSGDGASAFSIKDAPTSLTAYTPASVNIVMEAQKADTCAATLTITAGELTKMVALMGIWEEKQPAPQPENWKGENFNTYQEGDELPMGWEADGWEIGTPSLMDTPVIAASADGGTLITPVFAVTGNQALQFNFQKSLAYWESSSRLDVSYSTNKEQWTAAVSYGDSEENGVKKVPLPAAGTYYVRFIANTRTYLDDFEVVDIIDDGIALTKMQLQEANGAIFNLHGQRISQPTKGLFIQNGNLFIKKCNHIKQ